MANLKNKDRLKKSLKDLEHDIRRYNENIAKFMLKDIADEMTDVAKSSIKSFYEQYDPEDPSKHDGRVYYYRHWNFNKITKRYYSNHNPKFYGGVELQMFEIPSVYQGRHSDPIMVFNRVMWGLHGIASTQYAEGQIKCVVPTMSPSPMELINDKFDYIINHLEDYDRKARIKAQKLRYRYIF